MIPYVLISVVLFVAMAWLAARQARLRHDGERLRLAAEAQMVKRTAEAEAATIRAVTEGEAREKAIAIRQQALDETAATEKLRSQKEETLRKTELTLRSDEQRIATRQASLTEREESVRAAADLRKQIDDARKLVEEDLSKTLERVAGETRLDLKTRLVQEWVDEARGAAEEELRQLDQNVNDAEYGHKAKRIMGIAVQRYAGHYLTERMLSNLPLLPGTVEKIFGANLEHIPIIEEVANIKLTMGENNASVRLEGQDSFGREIARRAVSRFGKNGVRGGDVQKAVINIKEELEREVFDLGKRAFKELEIPRAHPDIVRLVGRLNWRTSYTQNQWKHAVEAAFLCGMMASEMGLDVKLARRAALMHDIGKALTHAIDGSHAVIGADYARRLGESEVVANAIGAHHADEPCNSVYAYLVAASDAMSGARPGARREQTDNYVQRLDDLERIGARFPGVERAFAVQGGREVRVYVKEDRVSDERAVELSSEIASKISEEMTFPGQIKVTVVREVRAIAIAG